MKIQNQRDLWSGIMFLVAGILFIILSRQYQLGTAAKMGPGYFPTVLGGIMAVLGLIIMIPAFKARKEIVRVERFQARPILLILLGVAVFALTLPKLGFVIAAAVLIGIAAFGSSEFRTKETLLSIVVLTIGCYLTFVKGLELQFPVWPVFLTK